MSNGVGNMKVIAHNLSAMNIQRQFNINTRSKIKSLEKLSSGYRVNRAADDAASLSISEKMRRQIRGLNQGIRNTEDGISLIKTAEGALQEIHNILHRMRELTVQAANDVNSSEERLAIQNEMDSLFKEIDDTAHKTQFNSKFPLIPEVGGDFTWGLPSTLSTCYVTVQNTGLSDTVIANGHPIEPSKKAILTGITYNGFQNGNFMLDLSADVNGGSNGYSIGLAGAVYIDNLTLNDIKIDDDGFLYFTSKHNSNGFDRYYLAQTDYSYYNDKTQEYELLPGLTWDTSVNDNCIKAGKDYFSTLWIQSGANAGEGMYIHTVDASTSGIGLSKPDVSSNYSTNATLATLDYATKKISKYRGQFGAQQNRLEYALNANSNYMENLTNAESIIRDADMAEELLKNAKQSILENVTMALLAQANATDDTILHIFQ